MEGYIAESKRNIIQAGYIKFVTRFREADINRRKKTASVLQRAVFFTYQMSQTPELNVGGTDGTRTRDPLRDRQVF